MERYVAIDNVCAWPNLTRMTDGRMVATIFNQPTHGGWEGDVECWVAENDGRFWKLLGVAAPHEPGENRMNVAAGLARDGSLVVLASGWSKRNPVGQYSSAHDGEVLPMWVCRSDEGGESWTHSESISSPEDSAEAIIPFGDIVPLADGNLGVSVYGWLPPTCRSLFYASEDDGRTWTFRSVIRGDDANETALLTLTDGTVLAAVRTAGDGHLEMYRSEDHGASWEGTGAVTVGGQHPAHLALLADGRALLTYGVRNRGYRGLAVRLSSDGGDTWTHPHFILDLEDAGDLGYPASMQTDDGAILTAYYCAGVPAHTRYHMGVLRWEVDA